jgi:cathepsin L
MTQVWINSLYFLLRVVCVAWLSKQAGGTSVGSFEEFVRAFGRDFRRSSPEYEQRRIVFDERLERIRVHNTRPERLWNAGINDLTDRTDSELSMLRGWRRSGHAPDEEDRRYATSFLQEQAEHNRKLPAQIDWAHLATFAEVPNQGPCGSCWAVAAGAMLQARYEIHVGGNRTFSSQQMVNCVSNPHKCGGSGGCSGATIELALDYVVKKGLPDSTKVPYQGRDSACDVSMHESKGASLVENGGSTGVISYGKLPENKAKPLMLALMDGPVGISVAANSWTMYGNGIFNGCDKDAEIDHAVVMLGYGSERKANYWKIQNSWGSGWGEAGRIRLLRHNTIKEDDEYCGVDHDPKAGTACEPYPAFVNVCGMCGLLYDSVTPKFAPGNHAGKTRLYAAATSTPRRGLQHSRARRANKLRLKRRNQQHAA